MTYIYMFWIALLLLVVIGTVLSTFLYAFSTVACLVVLYWLFLPIRTNEIGAHSSYFVCA
jgi:hypothetical protein